METEPSSTKTPMALIAGVFLCVLLLSSEKAGHDFTKSYAPIPEQVTQVAPQEIVLDQTPAFPDSEIQVEVAPPAINHLPTPETVKGIYLTGWSAGNARTLVRAYSLIENAGINSVVIDIKDARGKLSYHPKDPALAEIGAGTNRIKDLPLLTKQLHEKGVYVIGRLTVFQDPHYASLHPEDAFLDTRGGIWRDYKGLSWLRPNSPAVWEYVVAIARDAHAQGFDEINIDYVRFPSDGPLAFLDRSSFSESRADTMEKFFAYMGNAMRSDGIVLSADLFGLTMSAKDDLGIGQKLELIAPHVDFVCPMVYPSHFASGAYGIGFPALHPYEIIHESLSRGIVRLEAIGIGKEKLRPWLQDFDLGAVYTKELVKDQIDASVELGVNSWLMWDPRNWYTEAALVEASKPQPTLLMPL